MAVPLNPETEKMTSEEELSLMKSTAILVSISPVKVIDKDALYSALKTGRIGGAGLDSQADLKKGDPMLDLENITTNVENFLKGKPTNVV